MSSAANGVDEITTWVVDHIGHSPKQRNVDVAERQLAIRYYMSESRCIRDLVRGNWKVLPLCSGCLRIGSFSWLRTDLFMQRALYDRFIQWVDEVIIWVAGHMGRLSK